MFVVSSSQYHRLGPIEGPRPLLFYVLSSMFGHHKPRDSVLLVGFATNHLTPRRMDGLSLLYLATHTIDDVQGTINHFGLA